MDNNKKQELLFYGSNRLTRFFPRAGARLLDLLIPPILSSRWLSILFRQHNLSVVRSIPSFKRLLILPDIHIGDAVLTQSVLGAIRDFFPDAHVDYVVNKVVYPLIRGNAEATRVLPLFSLKSLPSSHEIRMLRELIAHERYDLCMTFCTFISNKDIVSDSCRSIHFLTNLGAMIRNDKDPSLINHLAYQFYRFSRDLFLEVASPVREESFQGIRLALADSAVEYAFRFLSEARVSFDRPVILYNPDTASPYTRMPFDKQVQLLRLLVRLPITLLLGTGHNDATIGERLKASLPASAHRKVILLPPGFPLESYAALTDFCDVFVSGDTGPLHLASARRYSPSGKYRFRNRTAVMSFFGATPARLTGYDSSRPGYLPANQDAPSWCYVSESACRNITCINKIYKSCDVIRCFEKIDIEDMAGNISLYLKRLPHHASSIPLTH
ncbi:MAG: glycosyltransferase family 9 protein [Candidatus Omnitrophota bacterium]